MVAAAQAELEQQQALKQAAWTDSERLRNLTFKVRAAEGRLDKATAVVTQTTDALAKLQREMQERVAQQQEVLQSKIMVQQERQQDLKQS